MRRTAIEFLIWSVCLLISFLILLNWSVISETFVKYDHSILHEVNNGRVTAFDPIFIFLTHTSSYAALGATGIVFILSFLKRSPVLRRCGWQLLFTFLCAFIVIKSLKYSIDRTRPFDEYTTVDQMVDIDTPSFPSGHTLESAAMATTLVLLFSNKVIWAFAIAWAMAVAYSRILLGVHYPSDVIAGIMLGILLSLLCHWFFLKKVSAFSDHQNPERKAPNQAGKRDSSG